MKIALQYVLFFLCCVTGCARPAEQISMRSPLVAVTTVHNQVVVVPTTQNSKRTQARCIAKTCKLLCGVAICGQFFFAGCGLVKLIVQKCIMYEK